MLLIVDFVMVVLNKLKVEKIKNNQSSSSYPSWHIFFMIWNLYIYTISFWDLSAFQSAELPAVADFGPYPIITSWLNPGLTEEEDLNNFLTEHRYNTLCSVICNSLNSQNGFQVCLPKIGSSGPGNSTDTGKIY